MGHFLVSKHKRHGLQILYSEILTFRDAGEIKTISDKGIGLASSYWNSFKDNLFPNCKTWCKKESLEHPVKEKKTEGVEMWTLL